MHEFDNITGIYFVDEPVVAHLDSFESICVPFFNEKYSDLFWHINLLPSYTHSNSLCPSEITDIPPFEFYINKYASIVDKVNGNKDISIDHYPLFSKNGKDYVSDTWLYDMTIVSNKAKSIGAKITNCVQSFSDPGWRIFSCQKEMDFLLSTQLAFGTTIFEFFLYSRLNPDWIPMVDKNKPTYVYKIGKKGIKKVSKYDKYFNSLSWQGIHCVNGYSKKETVNHLHITDGLISNLDIPWTDTNPAFKLIEDKCVELNDITVKSNYDALVGVFTGDDNTKSYFITPYTEPKENYINEITVKTKNAAIIKVIKNGRKIINLNKHKTTIKLKSGESLLIQTH